MPKTILISAGHSTVPPKDPGAVSGAYVEAELALLLRNKIVANLHGLEVLTDGAAQTNLPLREALRLARWDRVCVELHFNASANPQATGIEVLSKPGKRGLAQRLAAAIAQATGLSLRGDKGWRPDNAGQHHRLAFCEKGGLIVEVAFISNPDDMRAVMDNLDRIAQNIAGTLRVEAEK